MASPFRPGLRLAPIALALACLVSACGQSARLPNASSAALVQALNNGPANVWQLLPKAPKARARACAATIDLHMHVVGGMAKNYSMEHQSFRAFDSWFLSDLAPQGVAGAAMATVMGDKLLLVGGEVLKRPTSAVWLWDEEKAWESLPAMPTARSEAGIATRGGQVFVAGGMGFDGFPTAAVEVFDLFTRRWSSMEPLPMPTTGGVLARLGDRLVYAGGRNLQGLTAQTWLYDFRTKSWNLEVAPLPTPRVGAAMATDGTFMVVMGGKTAQGPTAKVERYDRSQGWRPMADLPQPVEAAAATRLGEHLVLTGGWVDGQPSDQNVGMRFVMKQQ